VTKRHDRRRKLRKEGRAKGVPENDLERWVRLKLVKLEQRDKVPTVVFDPEPMTGHIDR
jgi:hypothetical protein